MHRLRLLLGQREAVVVSDGRVSLHPDRCWIDLFEFEAAAADALVEPDGDLAAACRALMLYSGHFLEGEEAPGWIVPARERLRSTMIAIGERFGRHRGLMADAEMAIDFFRMGLARDPLNQAFVCGLMRSLARAGRPAEACAAYERLAEATRAALGAALAPQTEQLYREIRAPFEHKRNAQAARRSGGEAALR